MTSTPRSHGTPVVRRRLLSGTVGVSVALASASGLLLAPAAGASPRTSGATANPSLFDRETVLAELSPSGSVKVARLFSQLTAIGNGRVDVFDPTSTKGLRNLDGFSLPAKQANGVQWSFSVDGTAQRRLLADFPKEKLPVSVQADYTLNGLPISPSKLVGKSGSLGVVYTVKNLTGVPTQITFADGHGVKHTETSDVVTPLVGQLSTTLPSSFDQVSAARADIAGDGRGGSQLVWTMVLFSPIGDTTQRFGYTAQVHKAKLPPATVQIVPVPPKRKPELAFGENGFKEGAATGAELTAGAGEIDANVIKLRDGSGELLSGLEQLAAGATTLSSGLSGQAIPGAKQLAAGLDTAKAGALDPVTGLPALAAGATRVSAGAVSLKNGLQQIAGGLDQLAAVDGLPAAKVGATALRAGVTALLAGLGDAGTSGTILNGLAQISGGLAGLGAGLPTAKGGVDAINAGLAAAKAGLDGLSAAVGGSVAEVNGAYATLGCTPALNPVCSLLYSAVNSSHGLSTVTLPTLAALSAGTTSAMGGLAAVSTGLAGAIAGVAALSGGATLVTAGVNAIKAGLSHPVGAGGPGDPGGMAQGLDALIAGLTTAVAGVTALDAGAATASAGSTELSAGAGLVADGASKASTDLGSGLTQLAAGGHQLSDGLAPAASGANQIADGLTSAVSGGRQINDGTGRLHKEGTSVLVTKGNSTTLEYGKSLAIMQAMDAKAKDGAVPYGLPDGGSGSAAYVLNLAAQTNQSSEGLTRAALAILLLGLGVGAGIFLRRRNTAAGLA